MLVSANHGDVSHQKIKEDTMRYSDATILRELHGVKLEGDVSRNRKLQEAM